MFQPLAEPAPRKLARAQGAGAVGLCGTGSIGNPHQKGGIMGGIADESYEGCLSVEDWQCLNKALGKFRAAGSKREDNASAGEVMSVLESAGATDAAALWGALSRHFRVIKISAP